MRILKDTLQTKISSATKNLHPAYFALVMATGIVSIASYFIQIEWLAYSLFILNILFYIVLFFIYTLRILFFARNVIDDFRDFSRGMGYFTIVAGSCILGNQFVIILNNFSVAFVFWIFSVILWLVLIYGIFTVFLVKDKKPGLEIGINGGWLVSIVATQAVSILGGLLSSQFGQYQDLALFMSLTLWLFGGMLYIWIIMLIFQRYLFYKMEPFDLSPPYWINMGAVAITTLAGDILIENSEHSQLLQSILPFLKGFTLFFWATATWWIPILVILGIWRHVYKKFQLKYDSQYWSAVFPLGMYTVCTFRLAKAIDVQFLYSISDYFIYLAIAAWITTFIGLVRVLFRSVWSTIEAQRIQN